MNRIVKNASKVIGVPVKQLDEIAERAILARLEVIVSDPSHPLHTEIMLNRSGRIRLPRMRTNRFRQSFLPSAMLAYNRKFVR